MIEPIDRPLVDPSRTTVLHTFDCGHRLQACVAIEPDGSESMWVVVPGADEDTPRDPWPDHERTGPLPARFAQPRCGRPRVDGKPCRTPVAVVGQTCGHHRHGIPAVLRERKGQAP